MSTLLKWVRLILSRILLTLDRLFQPRAVQRTPEQQEKTDQQTSGWILYHFEGCPFCIIVRRKIRELNLKIEMREVLTHEKHKQELLDGGKDHQVPCLMIPGESGMSQWMYESSAINSFLMERFGKQEPTIQ